METSLETGSRSTFAVTLEPLGGEPRAAFVRLRSLEVRAIQLSAAQEGMRPRELDRSARRDLVATLRRREMTVAGVDAFIPSEHFTADATVDRAVHALTAAIEFAADLGRPPVSVMIPIDDALREVHGVVSACAERFGVMVANVLPAAAALADPALPPFFGLGIDPAAWLAAGEDPAAGAAQLGPRIVSGRLTDLSTSGMREPVGLSNGRLDLTAYLVALELSASTNAIVIDARQWRDPWGGVERTLTTIGTSNDRTAGGSR